MFESVMEGSAHARGARRRVYGEEFTVPHNLGKLFTAYWA